MHGCWGGTARKAPDIQNCRITNGTLLTEIPACNVITQWPHYVQTLHRKKKAYVMLFLNAKLYLGGDRSFSYKTGKNALGTLGKEPCITGIWKK